MINIVTEMDGLDQQGEGGQNVPAAQPGQVVAPVQQNADLPITVLTEHFTKLEQEMRAAGAHSRIGTFSGEGSGTKFVQWTKDLERLKIALNADDERMRFMALQTLSGQAAEYASSLIRAEPDLSWDRLKRQLRDRYSDLADVLYARQRLKRLSQKKGESVQNFFQRILSLAEESYPGQDIRQPVLQEQLMEIFVDGLTEASMAKRLLRVRPDTLNHALRLATQEQSANRTFQLRRGEEEMEVDEITRGRSSQAEQVVSQVVGDVSDMINHHQQAMTQQWDAVNALTSQLGDTVSSLATHAVGQAGPPSQSAINSLSPNRPLTPRFPNRYYYSDPSQDPNGAPRDIVPECWRCKEFGHFSKDCPSQPPGSSVRDSITRPFCIHCQRTGHHVGICWLKRRQNWQTSVNQLASNTTGTASANTSAINMPPPAQMGEQLYYQSMARPRFQWADDGRPICAGCGITGHKRFECRKTAQHQHLNASAAVSPGPRKH